MQDTTQLPAAGMQQGQQQAGRSERIYETEEIILKAKMLESEFMDRAMSIINTMALTMAAKLSLIGLISMAFDQNAVLANNPDVDLRILRFEEAMNKAKLTFSRPDVMNPALPGILENLRQAFRDFVSRSYNMGERKMQGERKIVQQTNMSTSDTSASAPQQQRKHGFDLIKEKLGM